MVKLETISTFHLSGHNIFVVKHNDKSIVITPNRPNIHTGAIIQNIEPIPGKYLVTINLSTQHPLYWHGTYYKAKKIHLVDGKNEFPIEIINDQKYHYIVGFFFNNLSFKKSIRIFDISVTKIVNNLNTHLEIDNASFFVEQKKSISTPNACNRISCDLQLQKDSSQQNISSELKPQISRNENKIKQANEPKIESQQISLNENKLLKKQLLYNSLKN